MLLRLYDDAFASDAMIDEFTKTLSNIFAQCFARFEIEAKVNGRRDFIDVLPTGALRANSREFDIIHRYFNIVGNVKHVYHASHTVAN